MPGFGRPKSAGGSEAPASAVAQAGLAAVSRRKNSKAKSSARWHQRQGKDPFVREAARRGLRSRAYFKLEELDAKYRLFDGVSHVLDLGASPGGWSQYAAARLPAEGVVYAVDALPMRPLERVRFISCDMTCGDDLARLLREIPARSIELALSDMAPNLTGVASADAGGFEQLREAMFAACAHGLVKGGTLAFKLFNDAQTKHVKRTCLELFDRCDVHKPKASRPKSQEIYMVARNFRG